MAIISPITLATDGYVCDSKIEPMAIGTLGVICVAGAAVAVTFRALRRTIQLSSLGVMGRRQ